MLMLFRSDSTALAPPYNSRFQGVCQKIQFYLADEASTAPLLAAQLHCSRAELRRTSACLTNAKAASAWNPRPEDGFGRSLLGRNCHW
jgi:hypothetical protein